MDISELEKLVPNESYVKFAGSPYKYAGYENHFGAIMVAIYDEPPSEHVDLIGLGSLEPVELCEKCAGPCKDICAGESESVQYMRAHVDMPLLRCLECHHEFKPF